MSVHQGLRVDALQEAKVMASCTRRDEGYVHSVIASAVAGVPIPKPTDKIGLLMPSLAVAEATKAILAWHQQSLEKERPSTTTLQPFEVQNYKRLMALESRGIDEYRKLRESPTLSAEAVVAFINQLSPWNLATTGIDVLNAYAQKQSTAMKEGSGKDV